jgi:hypothetical protein
VEGRAERRMGGEIMRGGRNGEYDGRFWRGVMTGWSKEGRRENHVEIGKWEEFREGKGRSSWAPTMETPDARTHRRSNGDGEHFARSVLAPPEKGSRFVMLPYDTLCSSMFREV